MAQENKGVHGASHNLTIVSDGFLNKITGMFQKGASSSVLGIDIGSSALKMVQLKRQAGRAVLETYGELALGPYGGAEIGSAVRLTTDKMVEAIKDLMREAKVTTPVCGLAIPISSSFVTMIKMPVADERQLTQMVPIEARKYIPVPISEVVMDWWVIPKVEKTGNPFAPDGEQDIKSGRMADVLLAVIHNEAVNRFQEVVKSAGLQSSFYEIEIFSTIRSALGQDLAPVMIFDMGARTTKLYFVEQGIVKGSHVINRGSQDLTAAISRAFGVTVKEAEIMKRSSSLADKVGDKSFYNVVSITLSYIFSEANRVIVNFEKKSGQRLNRVVLTGGGSLLGGFLPLAKSSLEADVELADPFSKVQAPAFLDKVLKQRGPEFDVAIGVALRKLEELS